jgi:diguanylate cyclase (GGDEF)-like protein/PAS domain S-box-containing protein
MGGPIGVADDFPAGGGMRQPGALTAAGRSVLRDPVLGALGAVYAVALGWFGLGVGGTRVQLLSLWLAIPAADVVLLVLAVRLSRLAAPHPAASRFWRSVVVAGGCFLAGDLAQAAAVVADPDLVSPVPGLPQSALVIAGVLTVLGAMLGHPTAAGSSPERIRFWLDALCVMLGAGVLAWCLMLGAAARPDRTELAVALLGCGTALVSAFAVVRLLRSAVAPLVRSTVALTVLAAVAQFVGSGLSGYALDSGRAYFLLLFAPGLLVVAGLRVQQLRVRHDPDAFRHRSERPYSRLPYVTLGAVFALLFVTLPTGLTPLVWGVLVGLFLIVVLVVARQLLALHENENLLERLDATLLKVGRQEQRLRALLQHSSDITSIVDLDGTMRYVNPSVERILGHPAKEVTGSPLARYLHPEDGQRLRREFRQLADVPGATYTYQGRYRHADGSWRWLEVRCRNLVHEPGVRGIVCNSRDVSEARKLQDLLRYQASHDGLTGLPNRSLFNERLATARTAALLLIDLDDFKQINDTYGHHAGDEVLKAVAQRLCRCLSGGGTAARLGGDEFALVLPGADAATGGATAGRLLALLDAPVRVDGHALRIGASVGVVAGDTADPEALLRAADARMYEVKRDRRALAG